MLAIAFILEHWVRAEWVCRTYVNRVHKNFISIELLEFGIHTHRISIERYRHCHRRRRTTLLEIFFVYSYSVSHPRTITDTTKCVCLLSPPLPPPLPS